MTEDIARASMRDWHKKLRNDRVFGQFMPTRHCPSAPDLWQVGIDLSSPPTPFDKPPAGTFFLVRWRPPYRFTHVVPEPIIHSNITQTSFDFTFNTCILDRRRSVWLHDPD